MNIFRWGLFLILYISSVSVFTAQLRDMVVDQQANKTVLYLTVNGAFTHKIFTLSNPERVVLDLNNTSLKINTKQLNISSPLIQHVRSGMLNAKTLRLVFDVSRRVEAQVSSWQSQGKLKGVQINLSPSTQLTNSKALIKKFQPTAPTIIHQKPIKVSHSPSKTLRDVIVVLDAGHGGKDPGARGPRNSKEKNVVLAITLKLKQLIDRQPGMKAVLSRSGDYYIGLRQRLEIARKYNGDIFVSIHADAFNNPHSNGASVFALSQSGATSEAARWLAEKENYSELGGVNLGDLDDTNGVVRSVLIDLSQTATISSSLQMGARVLKQLDNFTNLHNNKVEQARFMVLKSPDIPSILVETGFISNPIEEKNLNNSAYQARLSQALFQGIKHYFWDNPPHGTRIEAMTSQNFHIVKLGETLPLIAAQYHVSINAIQAINHFSKNTIPKPGQKLVIPSTWA